MPHVVLHDQEIFRIPRLPDHRQLVLRTVNDVSRYLHPVPPLESLHHLPPQPRIRRLPLRQREYRQLHLHLVQIHIAPLRYPHRVRHRILHPIKQHRHLLPTLHVILAIWLHLEPPRISQHRSRLDSQQHIVRLRILPSHIVAITRSHQLHVEPLRRINHPRIQPLLLLKPMLVDLQEIPVRPECLTVPRNHRLSLRILLLQHQLAHLPTHAPRQNDQPIPMLHQRLEINPRTIVEPLHVRLRYQLQHAPVSHLTLRQDRQVTARSRLVQHRILPAHRPCRHIRLHPQDRLYPMPLRHPVELHRPVHRPVIRQRNRLLPHLLHPHHQLLQT